VTAAEEHVASFNAAVVSGDFTELVHRFHPDAVLTFVGPPVGPFAGREAIAAAYAAMRLRRRDGLVAELTVIFD
jgi:steroid delta-isomerase